MRNYLLDLLLDLEHIEQNPIYHPEGDALFHSLQVFQLSLRFSNESDVWAASLFHDVGKAIDGPKHAQIGAEILSGILNENICWLIRHHLDLLMHPQKTNRLFKNTQKLSQLKLLRDFDLKGRDPYCEVCQPEFAVDHLLQHMPRIKNPNL
ncbi:HD domain-containing protein [Alteromonadaceae bacterium M269]|nr:HD domain-containing protein [Alteromonadaceae bacterium M269]